MTAIPLAPGAIRNSAPDRAASGVSAAIDLPDLDRATAGLLDFDGSAFNENRRFDDQSPVRTFESSLHVAQAATDSQSSAPSLIADDSSSGHSTIRNSDPQSLHASTDHSTALKPKDSAATPASYEGAAPLQILAQPTLARNVAVRATFATRQQHRPHFQLSEQTNEHDESNSNKGNQVGSFINFSALPATPPQFVPPRADSAQAVAPQAVAPQTAASQTVASQTVESQTVASQTVASQTVASQTVAPQAVAPRTVAPQAVAPQAVASQTVAPQTVASQAGASQAGASQAVASQAVASQTVASQTVASQTVASQTVASQAVPTQISETTHPDRSSSWILPHVAPSLPADAPPRSIEPNVDSAIGTLLNFTPDVSPTPRFPTSIDETNADPEIASLESGLRESASAPTSPATAGQLLMVSEKAIRQVAGVDRAITAYLASWNSAVFALRMNGRDVSGVQKNEAPSGNVHWEGEFPQNSEYVTASDSTGESPIPEVLKIPAAGFVPGGDQSQNFQTPKRKSDASAGSAASASDSSLGTSVEGNDMSADVSNATEAVGFTARAGNSRTAAGWSVARQVSEEVARMSRDMRTSRTTLQLRLDPPELGRVLIELQEVDGRLEMRMKVTQEATQRLVQEQFHDLRQSLENQGVQLGRCEVSYDANHDPSHRPPQERFSAMEGELRRKQVRKEKKESLKTPADTVNYLI